MVLLSNRRCFPSWYVGRPAKYRKGVRVGLIPCSLHLSDHCQSKLITATKQHNRLLQLLFRLAASAHRDEVYLLVSPRVTWTCAHHSKFQLPSGYAPVFLLSFPWTWLANQAREAHTQVFHTWLEMIAGTVCAGMLSSLQLLVWILLSDYFLSSSNLLCSKYASHFPCMGKV